MQNNKHYPDFSRNIQNLTFIGKVLAYIGCAKLYKNGDSVDFIWRWWNPLSYPALSIFVVINVLVEGAPCTFSTPHDLGLTVNPYYKHNPEKLEWIPYSALWRKSSKKMVDSDCGHH